jgi:hypothetical protein
MGDHPRASAVLSRRPGREDPNHRSVIVELDSVFGRRPAFSRISIGMVTWPFEVMRTALSVPYG